MRFVVIHILSCIFGTNVAFGFVESRLNEEESHFPLLWHDTHIITQTKALECLWLTLPQCESHVPMVLHLDRYSMPKSSWLHWNFNREMVTCHWQVAHSSIVSQTGTAGQCYTCSVPDPITVSLSPHHTYTPPMHWTVATNWPISH